MGFELCYPRKYLCALNQQHPYFFDADYMDNGFTFPHI